MLRRSISPEDLRVPDAILPLNGRDIPFLNNITYLGITVDMMMAWRHHIERTVAKAFTTYIRTYSLSRWGRLNTTIKLTPFKLWLGQLRIIPAPPGSMQRTFNSWNCSVFRTEYSAQLEILTGAHQSAKCTQLSKFLMCTTTRLNYAGHMQK
jgi:hypothetical protein